ncbi:MAG: MFS transporter [Dehalococcoidia bacterium]
MGRAMSAYQGGLLLGTGFGPSVGGFVAGALGFRAPFVLYLAMAAVSVVISLAVLPDRLPERPARATGSEPAPGFAAVARDGAFQTALAVAFVVFILRIGVSGTAVPLYASDTLGLSRALVGLAVTVWALSNFAFLFHAGRLADRRPRGVAISVGLTLTLLALGMLGAWRHVAGLYLGMVLLGAATAYAGVTPAALIADVTPPAHTATAMGLYRMAIDFGIVAGPIAAGLLTDAAGSARTFYVLAVPALLVLLPALRLRDTRRA